MHGNVDWPSAADTDAMIAKFIPLGVDQQITEMDISIYTDNGESFPTPPADRLARQAARYKALFDVYRARRAALTSVTLWGLADDTPGSTRTRWPARTPRCCSTRSLQAKPAYWAIIGSASPTAGRPRRARRQPVGQPRRVGAPVGQRSAAERVGQPVAEPQRPAGPSVGPSAPAGPCAVKYTVTGYWPGGFQGEVRLTNTGATAYAGWTVAWSFANGQVISQSWGGRYSQSGSAVTIVNESWNGSVAPGASATIWFPRELGTPPTPGRPRSRSTARPAP